MNRLHSIVALFPVLFLCAVLVGTAQNQFTIDATKQPDTPPRGRGPFRPRNPETTLLYQVVRDVTDRSRSGLLLLRRDFNLPKASTWLLLQRPFPNTPSGEIRSISQRH
jgi:hypothetical protein